MEVLYLACIGVVLGGIDVVPMIKQKLDRYSTLSAFAFHCIMPFLVAAVGWELDTWLKGGILYLLCAVPLMILAAKDDKKAAPVMAISSLVLGMISGFVISLM